MSICRWGPWQWQVLCVMNSLLASSVLWADWHCWPAAQTPSCGKLEQDSFWLGTGSNNCTITFHPCPASIKLGGWSSHFIRTVWYAGRGSKWEHAILLEKNISAQLCLLGEFNTLWIPVKSILSAAGSSGSMLSGRQASVNSWGLCWCFFIVCMLPCSVPVWRPEDSSPGS